MGIYTCKNCSEQIDLTENFKKGDIFDHEKYKCRNCGTFISRDQLTPEDLERDNWLSRYQHHSPNVQLKLGIIVLVVIFIGLIFTLLA